MWHVLFEVLARFPTPFSLQVDDPDKYHFKPKKMLIAMCRTVTNLAGFEKFVQHCVACGQADVKTLAKAAKLMQRFGTWMPPLRDVSTFA